MFKGSRLVEVCRLLNEAGARYLVVGGHACNLHGLIRATKDIDLLIPKDETNTEAVLKALKGLTWGIAGELDAAEVTKKTFTIIGDTPRVDLLTVAHRVKYAHAEPKSLTAKIEGVKIHYVDLETLLETKKTGRLQDEADIERLRQIAGKRDR
ncbi:MAG TPA: hypothetical protein VLJ37_08590 [bacterium]|nr:hypothetical protein [bacterium]